MNVDPSRFRRIVARLAAAAFAAVFALAESHAAKKKSADEQVKEALTVLVADYQGGVAARFMKHVDADVFPNFPAFQESVRDSLRDRRQINLDVIFDAATSKKNQFAAQTHWNRSFVDRKGKLTKQSGRCELLFHRRKGAQALLLIAIHGQSPF